MIIIFVVRILLLITIFGYNKGRDKEKNSGFECGFDSYIESRVPFSVRFFKILLIFILFDIEIILILPLPFSFIDRMRFFVGIVLLLFLIMFSLIFEWKEGSLRWL